TLAADATRARALMTPQAVPNQSPLANAKPPPPPLSPSAIELDAVNARPVELELLPPSTPASQLSQSPTLDPAMLGEAPDDASLHALSLLTASEARSSFATSRGSSAGSIVGVGGPRSQTPRQVVHELIVEVLPALLVSVAGSVLAGYILGQIKDYRAFKRIPALFILATVLLNLKSNIELNMSARLSTQANLGVFDNKEEGIAVMRSNMELLLLQSAIVGGSVGLISSALSLLPGKRASDGGFWEQAAVLLASGVGCSVVGSSVIGLLISATVFASHACGVDPDNIGTPIASSFGDMSTLLILGGLASVLVAVADTPWPLATALAFGLLAAVLVRVVRENHQMAHHFGRGWLPLVYAALTSSIA
ncbi:Histone acetyltransferase, partial [Coemansia spiralis]